MSRYISNVPYEACRKIFGAIPKNSIVQPQVPLDSVAAVLCSKGKILECATVRVAHGYDRPTFSYFIDILPDCGKGIYYGAIGITRQITRGEMFEAYLALGIKAGADAVALDMPY